MLLINPSFEDGHHHQDGVPELAVPNLWYLYFLDDVPFPGRTKHAYRPESVVWNISGAPDHEKAIFFLDGDYCLKIFKAWAPVYFALTQHVTGLTPGKTYKFEAPVYLDIVMKYEGGKKVYPGDLWSAEARVGFSDVATSWGYGGDGDIDWADWQNPITDPNIMPEDRRLKFGEYRNAWGTFVAPPTGEMRIWLECKAKWGFQNNFFFDNFSLVEVNGVVPPDCNPAREPYDSTIILLSPTTTRETADKVLGEYWDQRTGFIHSADDAFTSCSNVNRTVIAVDADGWPGGVPGLEDFRKKYYPAAKLEFYNLPEESIKLCMRDPRWNDENLAYNCPYTIGQQGCYVTNLAMAQRFYDIDKLATPVTVRDTLGPNGFTGCLPLWTEIHNKLNIHITAPSNVDDHLANGGCAMAEIKPASFDHFVLVVREEAGRYWMYDPVDGAEGWLDDAYDGVESWRQLDVANGSPPGPTPTDKTLVTGHIQGGVGAMQSYLQRAKPRGIKMIAWGTRDVFNWHPDIEMMVLRKWYGNDPDNGWFIHHADKAVAAKRYCDIVLPGLREESDWLVAQGWNGRLAIESLNESFCTLCPDNPGARDFDIAFAHELMSRNIPLVVPALFTAAVGNPHETEFESIVMPIARVCEQYNGVLCYHSYWGVDNGDSSLVSHWQWHAGRAQEMDTLFRQNGIVVDWMFSEASATYGPAPNYAPTPLDGWRASKCYNGNWPVTKDELVQYNVLLQQIFGENCYGSALFTVGGGDKWKYFEMKQPQWDDLSYHIV